MVTHTFRFHAPLVFVTNESKQIEQHGDDAFSCSSLSGSFVLRVSFEVELELELEPETTREPLVVVVVVVAEADAAATAMRACFAHIHCVAEALVAAEALEGEGSEELVKRT